jgi:hypothetical protein
MLEYALSNFELKDKKVVLYTKRPLKTVVETKRKSLSAHNSSIWCA